MKKIRKQGVLSNTSNGATVAKRFDLHKKSMIIGACLAVLVLAGIIFTLALNSTSALAVNSDSALDTTGAIQTSQAADPAVDQAADSQDAALLLGNQNRYGNQDAGQNGSCTGFVDADGDGVCDNCNGLCQGSGMNQGAGTSSNASGTAGSGFVDENNDGVCDNRSDGCANGTNASCGYVDADNDGICDNYGTNQSHHYGQGNGNAGGAGNGFGNGAGQGNGNHHGYGHN